MKIGDRAQEAARLPRRFAATPQCSRCLVHGHEAVVTGTAQRLEYGFQIDAARLPYGYLIEADIASSPGLQSAGTLRVEAVILQVDVENVGCEPRDRLRTEVLTAQFEIGRLVDEPEVRPVYLLKNLQRSVDELEEAAGVTLVRYPDVSLRGLISSSLGPFDIGFIFHADA